MLSQRRQACRISRESSRSSPSSPPLHDANSSAAMTSPEPPEHQEQQHATPPLRFLNAPLTPPATIEKTPAAILPTAFPQARQVLALFRELKAGHPEARREPWKKFQLAPGEWNEIRRLLRNDTDKSLRAFVKDKIRYDYDGYRNQLVFRMPSQLHERFITDVKKDIDRQLSVLGKSKSSGDGDGEAVALFARQIRNCGSPNIPFPAVSESHKKSTHSPDGTYYHDNAKWPGVILEVSYSQKRKDLAKLADRYILDSDANVKVVVGLDIEYDVKKKAGSGEAVFSVWRPHIGPNEDGDPELSAAQVITDQVSTINPHMGVLLSRPDQSHVALPRRPWPPNRTRRPSHLAFRIRLRLSLQTHQAPRSHDNDIHLQPLRILVQRGKAAAGREGRGA